MRFGLNKDLGFSAADRSENIRRIGEVAKLFADATAVAIAAFISPYAADRAVARALHVDAGLPFVEVHVDIPVAVAEQRDPKGLYGKARQGLIAGFTGVSAPYEAPEAPELRVDTAQLSVEQAVAAIVDYLQAQGLVSLASAAR